MRRMRKAVRPGPYPVGSCTEFAYNTSAWVPLGWGDAVQWPASAHAAGLTVNNEPAKNALAVFPPSQQHGPLGHVAPVVEISDSPVFTVWEGAVNQWQRTRESRYGIGSPAWFIHPPADPFTRLPEGVFGAGGGASQDPIVALLEAWDGFTTYWNLEAGLQVAGAALLRGMLAGLSG